MQSGTCPRSGAGLARGEAGGREEPVGSSWAIRGISGVAAERTMTAYGRVIGAVIDIPALIAWRNVLLPAIGLSSPQPPAAVARRARLYRPMTGSRQSNLRLDNAHDVGCGASGASP